MLTVSEDQTGIIWSDRGEQLAELCGHKDRVWSCAVLPFGRFVLTVSEDGTGIIWPMALFLPEPSGPSDSARRRYAA